MWETHQGRPLREHYKSWVRVQPCHMPLQHLEGNSAKELYLQDKDSAHSSCSKEQ